MMSKGVQRGESGADVVKTELVCSEQNAGPIEEHCSQMMKGLQAEPEGHKQERQVYPERSQM